MFCLQYDGETQRLYSCCDDKKVICWDVAELRTIKVFDGHKDKVYREALYLEGREAPEGGSLFAGDSTGSCLLHLGPTCLRLDVSSVAVLKAPLCQRGIAKEEMPP